MSPTDERELSRHELEHGVHAQLAELTAALEHRDVESCEFRRRVEELQRQLAAANASGSGNGKLQFLICCFLFVPQRVSPDT
jgi:hypothetical protein